MMDSDSDIGRLRAAWEYLTPVADLRERILNAHAERVRHARLRRWQGAALVAVLIAAGAFGLRSVPRRHEVRSAINASHETVTDFYPLMDAPPPLMHGILLRVTVPAAAIEIAGIPLREEQLNQRVEADLLLGDDGKARAIRFVNVR
ncbi:MAG TPA: hypothetical protein VG297_09465 [Bryobacteraceae bacterium]|jgi:hypothetical protein|nr:hypothetical protein [Bryobacteraceae bacterium]